MVPPTAARRQFAVPFLDGCRTAVAGPELLAADRRLAAGRLGHHKLGVERLNTAARRLEMNDVSLPSVDQLPVAFDAFADNPDTGAFILVDRYSNRTAGAATIAFALHRATNIHRERLAVDKHDRARAKHQRPCILWFTGLPASGKSSIARLVDTRLHASGCHTYMLDGDNIRHGLTRDLGQFADRSRTSASRSSSSSCH
jgi:bifunctional enzyme CysN/CysC